MAAALSAAYGAEKGSVARKLICAAKSLLLADVLYSAFLLAAHYELDVKQVVMDKLEKNRAKYPVEKAKGSRQKYDELC